MSVRVRDHVLGLINQASKTREVELECWVKGELPSPGSWPAMGNDPVNLAGQEWVMQAKPPFK